MTTDPCAHDRFRASVDVNRMTQHEGGPVVGFMAEVTVACAVCEQPFQWLGLDSGISPNRPMVSLDMRQLRAPITPQDDADAARSLVHPVLLIPRRS